MAKKLIKKVRSLVELWGLAKTDEQYRKLLICAAQNLGGDVGVDPAAQPAKAYNWLQINAAETDEKGVIGEVNFCRDLV